MHMYTCIWAWSCTRRVTTHGLHKPDVGHVLVIGQGECSLEAIECHVILHNTTSQCNHVGTYVRVIQVYDIK